MKTVLMSSAFALMLAPAAFADQMAVVDFNQDGIIGEADYIGPKSRLVDAMGATVATPQIVTQEVTRTVTVPGSTNTIPVSQLAPTGDNYVNIGEYQGGVMGTLQTTPATTRTVTETRQVMVQPATGGVVADIYPNPHGSVEAVVSPGMLTGSVYQPSIGTDGVITAAEAGYGQDQYVDNNLAAYDTNKDGQVTASEAIANIDPLIDPNVAAFYGGVQSPGFLEETNGGSRRSD